MIATVIREFEQGRSDVDMAHEVVAALRREAGCAQNQRNVGDVRCRGVGVFEVVAELAEALAVIGGEEHDGLSRIAAAGSEAVIDVSGAGDTAASAFARRLVITAPFLRTPEP